MSVSSLTTVASALPAGSERQQDRPGYFVAGAGAPVLMLHSSLSSKSQWTALAQRMASRFRVIAVDLCGYGDNALPNAEASFTLDDEVARVEDRLDRLVDAAARVHVVGHSYGALVALRLADSMRGRIASLSLFEPVAFNVLDLHEPVLEEILRLAEAISRRVSLDQRHDAARIFVDFWSGEGRYAAMPRPSQASLARRVDKLAIDFRAALSWPRNALDLRAISVPTLLLAGRRSPTATQLIHKVVARGLPDVRTGFLDCGHMGPLTHAHLVNPWIEAFVDACSERADGNAPRLDVALAPLAAD